MEIKQDCLYCTGYDDVCKDYQPMPDMYQLCQSKVIELGKLERVIKDE